MQGLTLEAHLRLPTISDERHFYEAVEAKMLLKMNSFLKAGTAMSNYTSVLTLLLVRSFARTLSLAPFN